MYLFIDTETTGLPIDWKAPIGQFDNWPRIVEISWILVDKNGNEIENETFILKPDGFKIPIDVSKIHGITDEIANEKGKERVEILKKFANILEKAQTLVAHNIEFDKKIVHSELMRYNIKSNIHKIDKICTKELTTDFCKIPGKFGYKWPTLSELYFKVFERDLNSSHSAKGDVKACKDCFFELINRGIIKLFGSKILINSISDTNDEDLIQIDDIQDEINYNGDFQYFTRVRHLGLKEHKFLKAYDEWVLEEKVDRQVERFNLKWEKAKIKLQGDYYKKSNLLDAEAKTVEAEEEIKLLETILEQTLQINDAVNWEELKNYRPFKEISPENYLQNRIDKINKPIQSIEKQISVCPNENDNKYIPKFNFIEKYFIKSLQKNKIEKCKLLFQRDYEYWLLEKEKIEKMNKQNFENFLTELADYNKQIEEIKSQNKKEVLDWEIKKEKYYQDQKEYNLKIDRMKEDYFSKKPHSIIENCDLILNYSKYPEYFPKTYELDYNLENELLIVDYCLPELESLPRVKSVKYIKTEDTFKETLISQTQQNLNFSNLVFQIALRTIHELFEGDVVNSIKNICFNGYIENEKKQFIISLFVDKETFLKIQLKNIDFKDVVKQLKGKFTAKFTEIEPIKIIEKKDITKKNIAN